MDIDIELFPESGKLIIKDDEISAVITDEELDPIKCDFHNDDCVQLDTDKYAYIILSRENLYKLIKLIDKAEKKYDKINKQL